MNSKSPHHNKKHLHFKTRTPLITPSSPLGSSQPSPESIITSYQNQISTYLTRNRELSNEITDLINTIHINESIIESFIQTQEDVSSVAALRSSLNEYLALLEEKSALELQRYQQSQLSKDLPGEIQVLQRENLQMKNELAQKKKQISRIEGQLVKERKHALFKDPREEVYIVSPTQDNIDAMNQMHLKDGTPKNKSNNYKKQKCLLELAVANLEQEVKRMHQEEEHRNSVKMLKKRKKNIKDVHSHNRDNDKRNCDDNKVKENGYNDNTNNDMNDVDSQIKSAYKQLESVQLQHNHYTAEIAKYKASYHKLKEEIHCLSHLIKKNSTSTQDTQKKNTD